MPSWMNELITFGVLIGGATWRLSALLAGIRSDLQAVCGKVEKLEGRQNRLEKLVRRHRSKRSAEQAGECA